MEAIGSENHNMARPSRRKLVSHRRRYVDLDFTDEVEKRLQRRARAHAAVISRFRPRATHKVLLQVSLRRRFLEEAEVEACGLQLSTKDTLPERTGAAVVIRGACADDFDVVRLRSADLGLSLLRNESGHAELLRGHIVFDIEIACVTFSRNSTRIPIQKR